MYATYAQPNKTTEAGASRQHFYKYISKEDTLPKK